MHLPTDLEARLLLFLLSAATGWLGAGLLPRLLRSLGLERVNYQGRPIGTGGGLYFLIAAAAWLLVPPRAMEVQPVLVMLAFGGLGFLDDRWGTAEFKGLRGHLRALRGGRVTTGLLKAGGGLGAALGLAWWHEPGWPAVAGTLVVALSANLFNLLDLRPLRCLKGFWLLGLPALAAGPALVAQCYGLSLPYARLEARRVVMLGDTGANALGALLGLSAMTRLAWPGQAVLAVMLVAFHLWAERNSLSAWIERHPWARRIDRWGWEEASVTPPHPAPGSKS